MIKVSNSEKKLETYFNMDIFSAETKERANKAEILLLPDFNIRENVDRAFQADTFSFYKYSMSVKNNDYNIELFENKGEEKVLALHSFDIWIPTMMIFSEVVFPVAINLVSSYVYDRMKGRPNDEPTVHFNLVIENKEKGISKNLSYKGSAEEFKNSFEKIDINKFWED